MRNRRAEQLVAEALEVLRGWGGPEGLRQVGFTREWVRDPYLAWGQAQARRIVLHALEGAERSPLEGESLRQFVQLYHAAADAGLPIPRRASARYRQVWRQL